MVDFALAASDHKKQRDEAAPVSPSPCMLWSWPFVTAAAMNRFATAGFDQWSKLLAGDAQDAKERVAPEWATDNVVALELPSMRLRDFSQSDEGTATVICAPFALHGPTVADFTSGHSLVERLRQEGITRLFATDWRSAIPGMEYFSIDTYLADLNVAVDECCPPVNLVGLCQGGWLALIYAARFPDKVAKLALAGAPIDVTAGSSSVSDLARTLPLSAFEELVRAGQGRVIGERLLQLWGSSMANPDAMDVLQLSNDPGEHMRKRFQHWCASTVDLPGVYYLEVVRRIFKENQVARGEFVALGRTIDLADVRAPLLLLAARKDEVVDERQLFAAADLVGTPPAQILKLEETCGHLSLFLGARTLSQSWPKICRWLAADNTQALAS